MQFRLWLESTDIRQGKSPLDYHGVKPERLYIIDSSVPPSKDRYFKDQPGLVAFLDYSRQGDGIFIHYINTRPDQRRKGYMRFLVDYLYDLHKNAGWIDFGRIFNDGVEKIWREKKTQNQIRTYGKL